MMSLNKFEITIMDGLYKINNLKLIFEIYILLLSLIIMHMQSDFYFDKKNSTYNEIHLIFLTNIFGICSLIFSHDWLVTIISWELFNISLYLMVTLNNYLEFGLAASFKYIILSALSTAFLLLGITIIYLIVGSTNYTSLSLSLTDTILNIDEYSFNMINIAFLLIICTILFKLSAAPFYQWAPDLYDGIHSNITMWMMVIPKIAVLFLFYILSSDFFLLISILNDKFFSSVDFLLLFSGILSLIIGSCALFSQYNIKRFLAYSSISHLGFILLALYSYDYHSYLIYIFIYGISTINIFSILLILSKYYGSELIYINQLKGLYRHNPFLSIAFSINLLSLAGVCLL